MAENLLILVPTSFSEIPDDTEQLISALREKGFIANEISVNGERHYRPGEEFMMLITFLGCSPMIATDDMHSGSEQYCHIAIEGPSEQPQFIAGDNIKIPRCPHCGHRHDNWQEISNSWIQNPDQCFVCPGCQKECSAEQLRWRKCAGFGRFFIKVWGIFESEAVPSPNLLALLQRVTGIEWQHFYVRHN